MTHTSWTTLLLAATASMATGAGCSKKAGTPDAAPAHPTGGTPATAQSADDLGQVTAGPADDAAAAVQDAAAQACPKTLGGAVTTDLTIASECGTIHVEGNLAVEGATLTLQAGVTLAFDHGASFAIGYDKPAKLIALGGPGKPVTLTSAGDKVPGAWAGLVLHDHADRTGMTDLVIEYAGTDDGAAIDARDVEDVTLVRVAIRSTKGFGVRVAPTAKVAVLESTFDQIGGSAALRVGPESVAGIAASNKVLQAEKALAFVEGGTVHRDVTWHDLGMPYVVLGNVTVEGNEGGSATLTIEPGAVLRFERDVALGVGYVQRGVVKVAASREKPVVFTANGGDEAGNWDAFKLYNMGTAELDGVVFEKGGGRDGAALEVGAEGALTLRNATFRKNTCGLSTHNDARVKAIGASSFDASPCALKLTPKSFGALAADNTYAPEAKIELAGGDVTASATWQPQTAPIEVVGNVTVSTNATLTLAAGLALTFREGVSLAAGYVDAATIKFAGTAEKHIILKGSRDEPGTWEGVIFYTNARGNEAHFVDLRNGDEPAAIRVDDPADLVADHVTCAKCKGAIVTSGCKAKLTATDLVASEGTPLTEKKPEGCQ